MRALSKAHTMEECPEERFTTADLLRAGLMGDDHAARRRDAVGALLGIGYGNARQFLKRLNHFGITRAEWEEVLAQLGEHA